jgi:hypothetical protein
VIVEEPAAEGVYVTEHSFAPLAGSEQLAALRVPASPAAFEKLTVPEGRIPVPAAELSATVAVQVLAWLITTDAGVHTTVVDDDRLATVSEKPGLAALAE